MSDHDEHPKVPLSQALEQHRSSLQERRGGVQNRYSADVVNKPWQNPTFFKLLLCVAHSEAYSVAMVTFPFCSGQPVFTNCYWRASTGKLPLTPM